MTFNFAGGQSAGNITNVAGDLNVRGDMTGFLGVPGEPELRALRAALATLPLRPEQRAEVTVLADELAGTLRNGEEDGDTAPAAGSLRRLVQRLRDWGALVAGGEALAAPLLRITALLGPAAAAVHSMIVR